MQENQISQEKNETKKVNGSYFEVPGIPISDFKGKSDTKKAQGSFFEVPGVPKSDFKGELGMKSEGKIEEKKTSEDSTILERKEPNASDFKAPGELETGYTEKSWAKPEEKTDGKEAVTEATLQERKEPSASDFKAPGELETGYTEKSWTKPEKSMEEKTAERTEEAKEGGAGEKEAKEKEARGEKRTVYAMEKRLTKSKTDRKLFGVCGGLGEYFGIDPTLVRLAFVLLTLFNGIGLALYIILAIIMPSEKNVDMVPSYRK